MKNLGNLYSYEIIDNEAIFYVGQGKNTDFSYVYSLSDSFVTDDFNLGMLKDVGDTNIRVQEITKEVFNDIAPTMKSAISDNNIANMFGLECNKIDITFKQGDIFIITQLINKKSSENTVISFNGSSFKYLLLEIE